MEMTQEHLDFEKHSRQLIGLTVLKVEYSEVDYDSTNPKPWYPTLFEKLDTVDFSVFLHCDNDILVEIRWDEQFFQFRIGFRFNEPSNDSGHIVWDVSGDDLWSAFIGTRITDIDITWETVTQTEAKTGTTKSYTYPQNMKIAFSSGRNIFISAAQFLSQNSKEVFGMMDNLMVTDNEELARQILMIR